MKYNIVDCIQRGAYSTNNSTAYSTNNLTITIESSISYQVVQNSKSYFQCLHHRLVPGKCFERHRHRSKLNSWYWQNGYIPDTGKVSGFWMRFVPGTQFYRQKTKYTKPVEKPVPITRTRVPMFLDFWERGLPPKKYYPPKRKNARIVSQTQKEEG